MNAKEILRDHELRVTPARLDVIQYFLSQESTVGVSDLNSSFSKQYDRATLYRTLQSFTDHGILHKVLDKEEGSTYALCESCHDGHHHDEHVHFQCDNCGKSICLNDVEIPEVSLPNGYKLRDANMLLEGTCDKCS